MSGTDIDIFCKSTFYGNTMIKNGTRCNDNLYSDKCGIILIVRKNIKFTSSMDVDESIRKKSEYIHLNAIIVIKDLLQNVI